jgi:D-aminoacyl-tRNA deacylase
MNQLWGCGAFAGLLCLVGLKATDNGEDAATIVQKVLNARVFHDSETGKKWAQSVSDVAGELLLVSQFTLYGRLKTKNPDFSRSMRSAEVRLVSRKYVCELGAGRNWT